MKYTTKYDIGDHVWFMNKDVVCDGYIDSIIYVKFRSPLCSEEMVTKEKYNINNVIRKQFDCEELFPSKELLIASL